MPTAARARPTREPTPVPPFPEPSDALGEVLHCLRMDGVVYTLSHLTAPWGVELPPMPECVLFHVVTAGSCVLQVEGEPSRVLRPGEFVLVPHGQGHGIASGPRVKKEPLFDLPLQHVSPRYEILEHGGGGERTTLICGAVRFTHLAARDLIAMLPKVIHIETWNAPHAEWMHSTLRLMAAEAQGRQPGGETIVTRLADILVIQAIRTWLRDHPDQQTGWIAGLRDDRLGGVILQIHRDPSRPWTVESLAKTARMSRSAFSARFAELVGETPMNYLTRWRMGLAGSWLSEENATLAECAAKLGYQSEAAFSRAFKRVMGVAPGGRKQQQQPG